MTSTIQTRLNSEKLTVAHHDYNTGLNMYASFKLHDSILGKDLVQDTFTKTWAYLVKGGKIVIMKGFLYHILNNLIIDEYRKRKHVMESLDILLEKGFEPKDEESEHFTDFLDGKAAMDLILELPKIYQDIIHMRFTQNLSLAEISLITGQTRNSTSVQIHRGLEKLKVLYGGKTLSIHSQ